MRPQLKYLAKMKSGEAIDAAKINSVGPTPVYGGNGLRGYTDTSTHETVAPLIGRQGALCGNVHFAKGVFFATEHAIVAQPRNETDPRWLYWVLQTLDLGQYSMAAAQPGLSVEVIERVRVGRPPLATQTAIADYLDRTTAAIDALIAKKELLIEELRKYLKAKTTEVVLRGLNEHAPLKQSPVAAMGLIPAHWQVAKTARVLKYVKGVAVPKEALATEGEESKRFLRTGDYWNVNGYEKDKAYVENTEGLVWKAEGEMVVCFDGFNSVAGKGTVGMARFEGEGYIDSHLELITPKDGFSKRYLEYVHFTDYLEHEILKAARGAIAYSAGYGKYDLFIPAPPYVEQEVIALHLDQLLTSVAPLMANIRNQLKDLRLLRTALVAEKVSAYTDET